MPSALISCIFVHADTIRMPSLSTTSTRHSTPPALAAAAAAAPFFGGGGLYLTTSFIISENDKIMKVRMKYIKYLLHLKKLELKYVFKAK